MLAAAALRGALVRSVACRSGADANSSSGSSAAAGGRTAPPPPPPAGDGSGMQAAARQQPWQMAAYYTKKLERRTDALGNILSSPETIAAAPGWTPDTQLRLAAEALAPQLQQNAAALLDQARLNSLLAELVEWKCSCC